MDRHYVSNKDESVRMFRSDFIELFSKVHPVTPHVIFVPILVYLLILGARGGLSLGTEALLFLFGVGIWTLLEYVLHRFLFHFAPQGAWQKRVAFIIHGVHHGYPRDSRRLVMPPSVSLPMAVPFFLLYQAVFGAPYHYAVWSGTLLGYLMYDTTHFAVHHFRPRTRLGMWLRQNHMRHHYLDPDSNYGVTSPMWDVVFGTRYRGLESEREPVEGRQQPYALTQH